MTIERDQIEKRDPLLTENLRVSLSDVIDHLQNDPSRELGAEIGLASEPELLEGVISREQILQIANLVGRERLVEIASIDHSGEIIDYEAAGEQEDSDLDTW